MPPLKLSMPRQKPHPLVKQVHVCMLTLSQHPLSVCPSRGSGHAALACGPRRCPLPHWLATCCLLPFLPGVALPVELHTLAAPARGPVLPHSPLPDAGSDPRSLHAQLSGPPAAVNRARPAQGCPFGIVFTCCPLLEPFNLVCQIYNLG